MIDHALFAQEVRLRYLLLLQALTGIIAKALDAQDINRGSVRTSLLFEATTACNGFLTRFEMDLAVTVQTMVKLAMHDSGMLKNDKLTQGHIDELNENASSVLAEMMLKARTITCGNIATVVNEMRQVKLTASLLQSTGMTQFGALMKSRMGRVGDIRFTSPDSMGRKWRSSDMMVSMISKDLVQLYIESFLYCAALDGDKQARVVYSNRSHINHGVVFNIIGQEGKTFDNIKDLIWHPNSTAGVERVHP